MKDYNILVINPGSTSTKIAVFKNAQEVMARTLRHSTEELRPYAHVANQFGFRKQIIADALLEAGIEFRSFDAVIGRGGLVKPIPSGVYEVNDALKRDLVHAPQGEHASNLGGLIAADIAAGIPGAKAYIADPVVVDEMQEVARMAGHILFRRVSIFHALNQKAIARDYAQSIGKKYEELNLVIAHLGGGVSVGAHRKGKVIDVNNALNGDGPYSPERSGTLPAGQLAALCFSGKYTPEQVRGMLCGKGGLVSLLGSNNVIEIMDRYKQGDEQARKVIDGMSYNVGKYIGEMAAVLHGKVDAILITGGIAHSSTVCDYIRNMVSFIAPVVVMAGEDEMKALAENALRALSGEVQVSVYE